MGAMQYISKNMYQVKDGNNYSIVECSDQMILENMVKHNMIDEYKQLKVLKIY